jgi:hypothetical protein
MQLVKQFQKMGKFQGSCQVLKCKYATFAYGVLEHELRLTDAAERDTANNNSFKILACIVNQGTDCITL